MISSKIKQVRFRKGIPFEIKLPNKITLKAFWDSESGIKQKSFRSVSKLLKDLKT
jgi:antitoxin component of RelBE/YafQ-DinJ toxin-antitoxin module